MDIPSSPLLQPVDASTYWRGRSSLFVHNWRTAGTTMHSLLACNLGSHYIKVGDALDDYGRVARAGRPGSDNSSLAEVRPQVRPGCVLAGHLAVGLDALLPGAWDTWMSARAPIERVRSGLLRFHSRPTTSPKPGHDLIPRVDALDHPDSVRRLLEGPLLRESNGMCRRLAALSLCEQLQLDQHSNLEKVAFLEGRHSDAELLDAARQQLSRISCLFLAEELMASVVCLEKRYQLPPLINPFTTLRHNSSRGVGYSAAHVNCLDQASSILVQSQKADLALWPVLVERFRQQVKQLQVKRHEVELKQLIHNQPLFDRRWFAADFDPAQALELMAQAVLQRAAERPDLAEALRTSLCTWPRLSPEAQEELRRRTHQLSRAA